MIDSFKKLLTDCLFPKTCSGKSTSGGEGAAPGCTCGKGSSSGDGPQLSAQSSRRRGRPTLASLLTIVKEEDKNQHRNKMRGVKEEENQHRNKLRGAVKLT